ncbi:hypothetical protein EDC14_10386 [Hydrogenispora ethanolica]|uniref:Sce7725 family protein n=1 Tax=Hydrogenispora ethanolica TaxID=1082276 RepID=A0A4R1R2U0_HYDET|nr:sce7725 family protein [Hydrogenispora ethanolica]TCL59713.1 hypothetical protein EDC14_10386 [Hydrogenispora ethanolica]
MYFPYLRGRQYELLALSELVDSKRLGKHVMPVIEPIKLSSTLINTLNSYIQNENEIAIIHNPQVGSFLKDLKDEKKSEISKKYEELLRNQLVIKAHIFNTSSQSELTQLKIKEFNKKDLMVICNNRDFIDLYSEEFSTESPRYSLIPDESVFRRKIKSNRILLDDKFEKQNRNTDYAEIDEPFSDDHLFYQDDEFIGFSDFSIVGDNFLEAGFAPYAVALHVVYFAEDKSLRIKHFVSDSNEDITNPAGKFYEALKKLNNWDMTHKMNTLGLKELLMHFKNETYPGLGTIKKLTIMHHIELIGQYLDEVE